MCISTTFIKQKNMEYKKQAHIRWSDLDPNYHLRHSAFYDLAAQFRTEFLQTQGIGIDLFMKHQINPVLLKEEGVFKKEIRYGQEIYLRFELKGLSQDFSKYAIQTTFLRADDEVCATVTVFGGWLDVKNRKLAMPPQAIIDTIEKMPKLKDFELF
jgi:acyl-CoA thioester hydrolase